MSLCLVLKGCEVPARIHDHERRLAACAQVLASVYNNRLLPNEAKARKSRTDFFEPIATLRTFADPSCMPRGVIFAEIQT
jgi:hypothetical protein